MKIKRISGISAPVRVRRIIGAALILLGAAGARAATGDLDVYNPVPNSTVNYAIQASDTSVYLGGFFSNLNFVPSSGCLGRTSLEGFIDTGYTPSLGEMSASVAILEDGSLVSAGNSTIRRVSQSGIPDPAYNVPSGGGTTAILAQPDGKVLIGEFTASYLRRVLPDGTVDPAFSANVGSRIESMALQQNGGILIGGSFSQVGGTARTGIARLTSTGALDTTFNCTLPAGSSIKAITLQPDGRILMAGSFSTVNGTARAGLARLTSVGALDTTFTPTIGVNSIESMVLQTDGKILIAGAFTSVNGTARTSLARLNADGTLDPTLNPSLSILNLGKLMGISLQSDGKILVAGDLIRVNGTDQRYVARLLNDPVTDTVAVTANRIQWSRGGTSPETHWVSFARSTDGVNFTPLNPNASATRISGGWELTGLNLPSIGYIRARARTVGGWRNGSSSYQDTIVSYGPTPEISVTGNSNSIADGDSSPRVAIHTDFGSIQVVGETVVRTFTIRNTGASPLAISGVTITGANAADFTVTRQPATSVAATTGSTTVQVTFNPSGPGVRAATLSIANNDLNENPFNFALQGAGVAPEVAVIANTYPIFDGDNAPSTLYHTDFGALESGTSLVRTYTIRNSGNAPLTLGSVSLGGNETGNFSVTAQPASPVAPAGSTTFQVTFQAGSNGRTLAEVNFTTNDADEADYNFSIRGTGLASEVNVTGNNVDIADGDITPDAADHTDFGNASTSGASVVRTFTVKNTGSRPLTVGSVSLTGTGAASFSVTAQPASPLAAAGITTFQVTFDPAVTGVATAQVNFTTNDPDEVAYNFSIRGTGIVPSPEIQVTGNGVEIVDADTTPAAADHTDFGTAMVTNGTITRTFVIQNTGSAPLVITGATLSGIGAAHFSIPSPPNLTIAPGQVHELPVIFDPSSTGIQTAILNINSNDANEGLYNFSIRGTGIAPEIAVSGNSTLIPDGDSSPGAADHTDFGGVSTASGTIVRTFTISNSGTGPLTVGQVTVNGTHAADFTVTQQPSASVAVGGSAPFQVTFNPSAGGIRTGSLSFANNDANENPYNFSIQGTGTAPEIAVSGNDLDIADDDLMPRTEDGTHFGGTPVDGGSVVRTFTIRNTGTDPLSVTGVIVSGDHAADFTVTSPPAGTVAAISGTTTLQVTFNPSGPGLREAWVNIANNDVGEETFTFTVHGTGLVPEVAVTGNGVDIADNDTTPQIADHTDFGGADVLGPALTRTFTITNSGTSVLSVGTVTLSGTGANLFSVTTQPLSAVAVGASTTFSIRFATSVIGAASAQVNFTTNDADESTYNFAIRGTGIAPEIDVKCYGMDIVNGDFSPSASDFTDFGSIPLVNHTGRRVFTISNIGGLPLAITGVSLSGPNAEDFSLITLPAAEVAAGASTTFQIDIDPKAPRIFNAIVSIASSDADENPFTFAIRASAPGPEAEVKGNGVVIADGDTTPQAGDHTDFGQASVAGATVVRTFTISNPGTTFLSLGPVWINGPGADSFSVTAQTPESISAGASATIQITFDPTTSGLASAELSFVSNDFERSPFNFNIQGTGTGPEVHVTGNGVGIADNDTTPNATDHTDFGNLNVSGATLVRTFTIANTGTEPLTVGSVFLGGTGAAAFSLSTQPAGTVAAGGSTTFRVTFDPSSSGIATAQVNFTTNDADEASYNFSIQGSGIGQEIAVTGNAVDILDGASSPSATDHSDFGGSLVAGGTVVRTFTIKNVGGVALAVTGVTLTGANAADFTVTQYPLQTVAAISGTTTFQITFNPSASGVRTATVNIANDDADENPFNFSVQGTGIAPEINVDGADVDIADGDTTPSPIDLTDFGSVFSGMGGQSRVFTIRNSGSAPLNLSGGVTIGGANASDFTVTSVPEDSVVPGSLTIFQVTFHPGAIGLRTATLSFNSNDSDESPFNFSIQGTGLSSLQYWRAMAFLTMENAGDAANDHDYDSDGLANIIEFGFGTNPKGGEVDGSRFPIASRDPQGRLVLEFLRRKASSLPGVTYSVETGPDPAGLTAISLAGAVVSSIDQTWERVTVTDPAATPKRFGRVRIIEP